MLIEYVPNLKLVFQVSVNYLCHLIFLVEAEILTEPRLQEIRYVAIMVNYPLTNCLNRWENTIRKWGKLIMQETLIFIVQYLLTNFDLSQCHVQREFV